MTDREFAIDVVRRLRESGYESLWAGGCVRDELLGATPADYDVATSARPEQVSAVFRRTIEVGASFGVVEVIGPRQFDGSFPKVQVATFRSDGAYLDGRRPESVVFSTAEADAQRRDFTINGMFFDPLDGRVIDYVGGQADLNAGVLRAIGDPRARFGEDKLRLLRAVRMAARFRFPIEESTGWAVREMADQITVVSAERIAEELRKMLAHPNRAWAVRQMDELGLWRRIVPETPTGEAWAGTLAVFDRLNEAASFELALAVLLMDLGKKSAGGIGRRLKLSVAEISRVEWLVANGGALTDATTQPRSRLYPLLVQPGIGELIALHQAREFAESVEYCERVLREVPADVLNPVPLITGDDLVAHGWVPGPRFKKALDAVRAAQLDQTITNRDEAIQLAEDFANTSAPKSM